MKTYPLGGRFLSECFPHALMWVNFNPNSFFWQPLIQSLSCLLKTLALMQLPASQTNQSPTLSPSLPLFGQRHG